MRKTITAEELYKKMNAQQQVVLVDVRAEDKYKDFHIEGSTVESIHVPKTDIFLLDDPQEENLSAIPANKEVIITCTTGNSAAKCANILSAREYDVVLLEGGITAWKEYMNSSK
ncbi:rhodanese-like domain-containing protein [Sporosarcina sp. PTS2304]|uniref:rhodanese-like domain-containing protein n=1 Tax=Sporosarcina sp. PTS2304 TaxID=2283194 RepID=UPI000E0D24E3|nr:rhodanese-like domain-containing protein [Sporosarcina sp. PTS2304]AXI00104.1 rhodanese-like domain-containing protein [Sporosarcina sp. PTS2304]